MILEVKYQINNICPYYIYAREGVFVTEFFQKNKIKQFVQGFSHKIAKTLHLITFLKQKAMSPSFTTNRTNSTADITAKNLWEDHIHLTPCIYKTPLSFEVLTFSSRHCFAVIPVYFLKRRLNTCSSSYPTEMLISLINIFVVLSNFFAFSIRKFPK